MHNLAEQKAEILAGIAAILADRMDLNNQLAQKTGELAEALTDFRGITALLAGVWSLLPGNIRTRLQKYREDA